MTNNFACRQLITATVIGLAMALQLHGGENTMTNRNPAASQPLPSLKQAVNGRFLIGTAIRSEVLEKPDTSSLLAEQFDCITSENELKPEPIHPKPNEFNFTAGDRLAAFAQKNKMKVIGHTLCWHMQSPAWMFEGPDGKPLPREEALKNLQEHIRTVVTHYKGQILGWDVVNEAIDNGDGYLRDTPAKRAIGDDFIIKAFEFAAAADPSVELYYNDYNNESGAKREKTIRLIREIKAKGLRINAVGIQGHWQLDRPDLKTIEEAILAYNKEGVKVMITELDIDVLPVTLKGPAPDPYRNGCPDEIQGQLAKRYADIFTLFAKHSDKITRVTFWGLSDGHTWLNNWPVKGRSNHPLLFDRQLEPKPAYNAVIESLESK